MPSASDADEESCEIQKDDAEANEEDSDKEYEKDEETADTCHDYYVPPGAICSASKVRVFGCDFEEHFSVGETWNCCGLLPGANSLVLRCQGDWLISLLI